MRTQSEAAVPRWEWWPVDIAYAVFTGGLAGCFAVVDDFGTLVEVRR